MSQVTDTKVIDSSSSKKLSLFYDAYGETDAHCASQTERSSEGISSKIEYTYGEISAIHFVPLLEYVKPKEGEILYDLGCGGGRPQSIAALYFP